MTVAATNMPPTGRDRHGKTPCAQGARRDPPEREIQRDGFTARKGLKRRGLLPRHPGAVCSADRHINRRAPAQGRRPAAPARTIRRCSGRERRAQRTHEREIQHDGLRARAGPRRRDLPPHPPRDRRKVDHCNRRHAPIPGGSAAPACPRGCGSGRDGTKNSRK